MAGDGGGVAGWLMKRWRGRKIAQPRLALLDRITLAPRQSIALVEAEGRRILVATSADGGPAFFPLDEAACCDRSSRVARSGKTRGAAKVTE